MPVAVPWRARTRAAPPQACHCCAARARDAFRSRRQDERAQPPQAARSRPQGEVARATRYPSKTMRPDDARFSQVPRAPRARLRPAVFAVWRPRIAAGLRRPARAKWGDPNSLPTLSYCLPAFLDLIAATWQAISGASQVTSTAPRAGRIGIFEDRLGVRHVPLPGGSNVGHRYANVISKRG